jgi:hypothetical protein
MIGLFEGEWHLRCPKLGAEFNHAAGKGGCSESDGDMHATSFHPDIQGAPLYMPTVLNGRRHLHYIARASPSPRRLFLIALPRLSGTAI